MPGFNVRAGGLTAPFTPELLAQLAIAGFRPPQAMSVPGLAPPPTPGFNVGDGIAGLGAGLGALTDFLTGFKGDPVASAMYASPRGPIPVDVIARGGWIGGGI